MSLFKPIKKGEITSDDHEEGENKNKNVIATNENENAVIAEKQRRLRASSCHTIHTCQD